MRGEILVLDSELRNNIDGEDLDEKLLGIITREVANDIEQMALYSRYVNDETGGGSALTPQTIMHQLDGWKWRIKEGGNVIDATDTGSFSDRTVTREKFRSAQKALKTKYRKKVHTIVPDDVMMDYEDIYHTVADKFVREDEMTKIAKKPALVAPLMWTDEPVTKSGGASTTIASPSGSVNDAGQNQIEVASATGIASGDSLVLNKDTAKEQRVTVDSVSSTTVTLEEDLYFDVDVGNTVVEVTRDGADAILSDPQNLIVVMQTGVNSMSFEAERVAGVGWIYHYVGNVDAMIANVEATALIEGISVS